MNITAKLKDPLVYNLLIAIAVFGVLIYATLKWLDSYTLHNQSVTVPDVKNFSVAEAARFLEDRGLRYNVIDSVYSRNAKPGAIVEVTPAIGSRVKTGRIVFITVNALTSQMASIPAVHDLSFRQAYALLKARGFESVEVVYIPGVYKDLAIRLELRGRTLAEGERIQLGAPLDLVVSNGTEEIPPDDPYAVEESGADDELL
ncbi:MAG: PASTA domain-containing protein [Tannerellaceae bacterium]|jgi:beta-lactam-binding protein with PASTA domain|nr:PASTA domain-containing protein [Tannerellaceae bacterium]